MWFGRAPETPPRGNPLSGTWESLPEARRRAMLASETRVRTLLASEGPMAAVSHMRSLGLCADELAALWMLFDSGERSKMRKVWT